MGHGRSRFSGDGRERPVSLENFTLPVLSESAETPTLKAGDRLTVAKQCQRVLADARNSGVSLPELRQAFSAERASSFEKTLGGATEPLVTEIYTQSSGVSRQSKRRGHVAGKDYSLELGNDLLDPKEQRRVLSEISKTKPFCTVLAFPCKHWSPLQNIGKARRDRRKWLRSEEESRALVDFAVRVAHVQLAAKRHFVIENPLSSRVWNAHEGLIALSKLEGVEAVSFEQCLLGLNPEVDVGNNVPKSISRFCTSKGDASLPHRHKKPTKLLTSSPMVIEAFREFRCRGVPLDHFHLPVIGGRDKTEIAGSYPPRMCLEIVKALERQWRRDHSILIAEQYSLDCGLPESQVFAADGDGGEGGVEDDFEDRYMMSESDSEVSGLDETLSPSDKELYASLMRMHVNSGHRSLKRLCRALAIAGAPRSTIKMARKLKCSICQEKKRPKIRRPAAIPRARAFADVVHGDLLQISDVGGAKCWVLNLVDAASGFQVCARVADKSSASVKDTYVRSWTNWAGPPVTLVLDLGREFASEEFTQFAEANGSRVHHVPVEAPWQDGCAERHGQTFKIVLTKIMADHSVTTLDMVDVAIAQANAAHNSDVGDSGFSPDQWVLGRNRRVPASTLEVGGVLGNLASHSSPPFLERMAMLETARMAITRLRFSRRLRESELARARTVPETAGLQVGDLVYFHRNSMKASSKQRRQGNRKKMIFNTWHGPAMLCGKEGDTAVYVGWRGGITKCAPEAVRRASAMESVAAESWGAAMQEILDSCVEQPVPAEVPANTPNQTAATGISARAGGTDADTSFQLSSLDIPSTLSRNVRPRSPSTRSLASSIPSVIAPRSSSSLVPPQGLGLALSSGGSRSQELTHPPDPIGGMDSSPEIALDEISQDALGDRDASEVVKHSAEPSEEESAMKVARSEIPSEDLPVLVAEHSVEKQLAELQGSKHPILVFAAELLKEKLDGKTLKPLEYHVTLRGDVAHFDLRGPSDMDAALKRNCRGVVSERGRVQRDLDLLNEVARDQSDSLAYVTAAKAAGRKELTWSKMFEADKRAFETAAAKHWDQWLSNEAVEEVLDSEARDMWQRLKSDDKEDVVMNL